MDYVEKKLVSLVNSTAGSLESLSFIITAWSVSVVFTNKISPYGNKEGPSSPEDAQDPVAQDYRFGNLTFLIPLHQFRIW